MRASVAGTVGPHGIFGLLEHLLVPLPGEVDEFGVRAHGNDLCPEFFEFLILLGQGGELGRANEGKVRGVEEKDGPLLCGFLGREADLAEITLGWLVGVELEIGYCLADPDIRSTALT